jgi:hypothetical protein
VSSAQAQGLAGASLVSEKEEPLGPTCVLSFKTGPSITMTIEVANFKKMVAVMTGRTPARIGGFAAECGTLRTPQLYVLLSEFRILNVSATCPVAKALAATALRRLHT